MTSPEGAGLRRAGQICDRKQQSSGSCAERTDPDPEGENMQNAADTMEKGEMDVRGDERSRDFSTVKDLHLFARQLILRKLHDRNRGEDGLDSTQEREALQALNDLLEEQDAQAQGFFRHPLF
ncbi:uncharacterized protein ACNLHF_005268 [Anomaloglossus baeobatrachus]